MPRARVAAVAVLLTAFAAGPAGAESFTDDAAEDAAAERPGEHVVASGESLWAIARQYGCTPDDLKRANGLDSDLIYPGRELRVPERCGEAAADRGGERAGRPAQAKPARDELVRYEVRSGDSLFRIAKSYDTTVDDLKMRNGLTGNVIRPGDTLDVVPGSGHTGRAIPGQSIGKAHAGRLKNPTRLARGEGYHIRRPRRTYGANHVVHGVRRAVAAVRKRHPKSHTIAVGDLSSKSGGRLSGHRSHQSGRDVDLGLVFKKRPKRYPKEFVDGNADNLDLAATWTLVSAFASTADADNGVERVFLGYDVQKLLYDHARKQGVAKRTLSKVFQYPHGRGTPTGIVRHEPAHDDHLHVRFKCPKHDRLCR